MGLDTQKFVVDFLTDYSDDTLIEELRRVAAIIPANEAVTQSAFTRHRPRVSASTLQRRFGSWQQALQVADLAERYRGPAISPKMKAQAARYMSKEDLILELQRTRASVGTEWLTSDDFNAHSSISEDAIRSRFGSFSKGLELAGISSHPASNKRISIQDCFENLAEVWTLYGRPPHYREMFRAPSMISGKAYDYRWGTWRKALTAFALWANDEQTPEASLQKASVEHVIVEPVRFQKVAEMERREVRAALRFRVFRRDCFRCVTCGRSPATYLAVELHADHIIAFANGGRTTFENLQTLCQHCNFGKGAS